MQHNGASKLDFMLASFDILLKYNLLAKNI